MSKALSIIHQLPVNCTPSYSWPWLLTKTSFPIKARMCKTCHLQISKIRTSFLFCLSLHILTWRHGINRPTCWYLGQLCPSRCGMGSRHKWPSMWSFCHQKICSSEKDCWRGRGWVWNFPLASLHQDRDQQVVSLLDNCSPLTECDQGAEGPWWTPGTWWQQVTVWPGPDRPRWGSHWGSTSSSQMWSPCPAEHTEHRSSRFILTSNSLRKLTDTTWQWSGGSYPRTAWAALIVLLDSTDGWTMRRTSPPSVYLPKTCTSWVTMAGLLAGEPWSLAAGSDPKHCK